jgi:hypothetical protein
MAATTLELCRRLFPGTLPGDLTLEQCHEVIQYSVRASAAISDLSQVADVIRVALNCITLRQRERLRLVCRLWSTIAESLRRAEHIKAVVPIREDTLHLGLVSRDPSYIRWVRTREQFNRIWPMVAIMRTISLTDPPIPPPELVTPEIVHRCLEIVVGARADLARWLLRLNYDCLRTVTEKDIAHGARVNFTNLTRELQQQSQDGTLDPRKIVWICKCRLGTKLSSHMFQLAAAEGLISYHRYSTIVGVALFSPELAVYNRVFCAYPIKSIDLEHPTHGDLLRRLSEYEPLHGICASPKLFTDICRQILKSTPQGQ